MNVLIDFYRYGIHRKVLPNLPTVLPSATGTKGHPTKRKKNQQNTITKMYLNNLESASE